MALGCGGSGELPLGPFPSGADEAPLADPQVQRDALDGAASALAWHRWLGVAPAWLTRLWSPRLKARSARRAFVHTFGPEGSSTGTGLGADLAAAVLAAAAGAAQGAGEASSPPHLAIEVATTTSSLPLPDGPYLRVTEHEVGAFGIWIEDPGGPCFATPLELIDAGAWSDERGALRLRGDSGSVGAVMARHDPRCHDLLAAARGLRFEARAWQRGPGGGVEPLRRGAAEPPPATRPELLRRAVAAGDYLAAALDGSGRFTYLFDAADGQARVEHYNLVRHAGAVWALLQLWARTGWERYGLAARRGLRFLLAQTEATGTPPGARRYLPEGEPPERRVKLGSAALAALAVADYARLSGDRRWLPEARELGVFLLSQIDPGTGRPRSYYGVPGRFVDPGTDSAYYPGQALLALAALYRADRDARWLEGARHIARYLTGARDATLATEELDHDHWSILGLAALHALDPEPSYAAHALRLARAIEQSHRGPDHPDVLAHPDYLGGTPDPPRAAPSAIRLEGLAAAMDLLAALGNEGSRARLAAIGGDIARQVMRSQVLPPGADRLANPCAAMGGVRASPQAPTLRIDYAQHAISAWLGLERHLPLEPNEHAGPPVDRVALFAGTTDPTAHHRAAGLAGGGMVGGGGDLVAAWSCLGGD